MSWITDWDTAKIGAVAVTLSALDGIFGKWRVLKSAWSGVRKIAGWCRRMFLALIAPWRRLGKIEQDLERLVKLADSGQVGTPLLFDGMHWRPSNVIEGEWDPYCAHCWATGKTEHLEYHDDGTRDWIYVQCRQASTHNDRDGGGGTARVAARFRWARHGRKGPPPPIPVSR